MASGIERHKGDPGDPMDADKGNAIQGLHLGKRPDEIHVLLVDDEKLSRVVVGNLLRKCNYQGATLQEIAVDLNLILRYLWKHLQSWSYLISMVKHAKRINRRGNLNGLSLCNYKGAISSFQSYF